MLRTNASFYPKVVGLSKKGQVDTMLAGAVLAPQSSRCCQWAKVSSAFGRAEGVRDRASGARWRLGLRFCAFGGGI